MRITLGKRIFGGFFIILLLLAVGSMISSNRIHFTDETYKGLINENVESAMLAKNLQVLYLGESNAIKKHKELQKTAKESIMDVQNLPNEAEERHNHSQK